MTLCLSGLGFKFVGVVLDQRLLKKVFIAIAGGLTTLTTTLLAISAEQQLQVVTGGATPCVMPSELRATLSSVIRGSGAFNASCSYILTVDAILGK